MTRNKILICLWIVFVVYIAVVIKLTFFKGVLAGIQYYPPPKLDFHDRITSINLVPFRTIKEFLFMEGRIMYTLRGLSMARKVEYVIQNLLGNIVMFIPAGFLIPCLFSSKRSLASVTITCFICSFTIECLQLLTALGYFDVDDMILNTLGGVLGFFIFIAMMGKVAKSKHWALFTREKPLDKPTLPKGYKTAAEYPIS